MTPSQVYKAWKKKNLGKGIDVDKAYGDQCVDVLLSYALALFPGKSWQTLVPPVPYAKNLFSKHSKYFQAIKNDSSKPDQLPQQGDVIIWNYGTAGHVAVVDGATKSVVTVVEQNGKETAAASTDKAHINKYGWFTLGLPIGWLRPLITTTKDVKKTESVPFSTKKINDPNLAKGTTKTTTKGVNGVRTIITAVTYVNGKQTSSKVKSNKVTKQPVTQVIAVGTKEPNVQPTPTPPKETKPAEPPVTEPETPAKPPVQEPSTPPASKTPKAPTETPQAPKINLWQLILAILKKLLGRS